MLKINEIQLCIAMRTHYTIDVKTLIPIEYGEDNQALRFKVSDFKNKVYFVKVLKKARANHLRLTRYLHDTLGDCVISPIETCKGDLSVPFMELTLVVYPFIRGKNGFEQTLEGQDLKEIGRIMRKLHSLDCGYLRDEFGIEDYPQISTYRERLKYRLAMLELSDIRDPINRELRAFMQSKSTLLVDILNTLDRLDGSSMLDERTKVLCHTDIHAGNIMKTPKDKLHIIDWDQAALGSKELDLMFFGGGIAGHLGSETETRCFYSGYGACEVDSRKLLFYRFSRIVEDIALFSLETETTTLDHKRRNQAFAYLKSNFLPGGTIECAYKTLENLK